MSATDPWGEPAVRDVTPQQAPPLPTAKQTSLAVALFFATVATTMFVGTMYRLQPTDFPAGDATGTFEFLLIVASNMKRGLPYSAALLSILLVHECGHYLFARRHRIRTSLPIFIPFPFFLGTFGAVIVMSGEVPNRRSILDVAVSGPLAGLVIAIIAYSIGLSMSEIVVLDDHAGGFQLGDSLLTSLINMLVIGDVPQGSDVLLHPVAFAGWIGLFITCLNLIPAGQLDGGHLLYALFPRQYPVLARLGWAMLLVLGFIGWGGWLFWAFLLALIGIARHPEPLDSVTELDPMRKAIGILTLLVFAATLVPMPFQVLGQ